MANEDSFINEVSEEVRRDRLFRLMRRYGWIAILAVVVLVGGAAWNEWRKATAKAEAEALGDAILAAINLETDAEQVAALSAIDADGPSAALLAMITAGQGSDPAAAIDRLEAVARDSEVNPIYRDLAALKAIVLSAPDTAPADRLTRLEPLTAPGAPYRPLALEQTAYAHIEAGDTEAALSVLSDILGDSETTEGLRRRASQLIVALGGVLGAT